MGSNSSSRHVSFDEEEGVTFVKGIRLSGRVIDRMRESPHVIRPQASTEPPPSSPPVERDTPIMPHPPPYTNALLLPPVSEPETPLASVIEETSPPGSPPFTGEQHVDVLPPQSQPVDPIMINDPITAPQLVETTRTPVETLSSNTELLPPPVLSAELPVDTVESQSSPVSPAEQMSVVLPDLSPVEIEISSSIPDPVFDLPQTPTVNEEELRTQIREDLQKLLNEEMKTAELDVRQQLEEERAKAQAQAQAAARLQIQEEVQKLLEEEKASQQQTLAEALRREQTSVQDERLITQHYWMERKAQKLEEKEKDLEIQGALFQQQIGKMQEKMAQFTKVTSENYKKGLEDAQNRFRKYQTKPVCSDLQSQILKCYTENKGRTMSCSNIASLYIQCVDRAKQHKKLNSGG